MERPERIESVPGSNVPKDRFELEAGTDRTSPFTRRFEAGEVLVTGGAPGRFYTLPYDDLLSGLARAKQCLVEAEGIDGDEAAGKQGATDRHADRTCRVRRAMRAVMTGPESSGPLSGRGVRGLLRAAAARLVRRLRPPAPAAWRDAALAAALVAAVALPVAVRGGFLPFDGPAPLWRLAALLVVPALAEETLYRGLLLPLRPRRPWLAALPQLALYVAAHPLVAHTARRPALGMFDSPAFLLLTLLLGTACTWLVLRHRSLWPAVALHAVVVVGWGIGGGLPPLG